MSLITPPVNPLSKIYTLGTIVKTTSLRLKQETEEELEPEFIKTLVNLSIMDVFGDSLNEGINDYGFMVNLTDIAGSVTTIIVNGANYTDADTTINKTAHGLNTTDLYKRIMLWTTTRAAVVEVTSIIDVDKFTVSKSFGVDVSDNSMNYALLPFNSSSTIDISSYSISRIIKITSSTVKEIIPTNAQEFENLSRFDTKQNKIFWYQNGQYLFLYIGINVSAVGDFLLYANGYPQLHILTDELIDVYDKYVPLIIERTKKYCLEHLGLSIPSTTGEAT